MDQNQSGKRQFLKRSAALVGMALGAIRSASGQNQNWALGYQPDVCLKSKCPTGMDSFLHGSRISWITEAGAPAVPELARETPG